MTAETTTLETFGADSVTEDEVIYLEPDDDPNYVNPIPPPTRTREEADRLVEEAKYRAKLRARFNSLPEIEQLQLRLKARRTGKSVMQLLAESNNSNKSAPKKGNKSNNKKGKRKK